MSTEPHNRRPAPLSVVDDRGMPRRSDKPWVLKRPGALLRRLVDRHSLAGPALLFVLLDLEERLIDSVRWRAPEPTPTDDSCWMLIEEPIQAALRLAPKDVWVPQHTLAMVRCRDGEPAWQWDDGYWTKAHLAITGNMGAFGYGRAFCGDFLVVTTDLRWVAFGGRRTGRLRLPAAEVIDLSARRPGS